jgi:hypothetical protein
LTRGVVTRTYTYGLQRIDEEQIVGNVWIPSFYGYDGGGIVRQLMDATGTGSIRSAIGSLHLYRCPALHRARGASTSMTRFRTRLMTPTAT